MRFVCSLLIAYSSQICEHLSYQCHRRAISRRKNIKVKRKTSSSIQQKTTLQSWWSSWTCLTLFNLLTLGKVQASMSQLSLNRKFQDLSAEKNKKRLAVRCWNKLTLFNLLTLGIAQASLALLSLNRKFQHDIWSHLLCILSFLGSQFNTYV